MPNNYYNAPPDNVPLTTVRSANENVDRQAVEAAFDRLPSQIDLLRNLYGVDNSSIPTLYEITVPYITGSYTEGQEITFQAALANTGGANIQINGLQIVSLLDANGAALSAGIIGQDQMIKCIYTPDGDFRILNVVNVGSVGVDQTANYGWSGIHSFTGTGRIHLSTGQFDNTAIYGFDGGGGGTQAYHTMLEPDGEGQTYVGWTGGTTVIRGLQTVLFDFGSGFETAYHTGNINETVIPIITTTSTSYTPTLSDRNAVILMNNSAASVFNVPSNASVAYPIGTVLSVNQYNTGQVTIDDTNATVVSEDGLLTNARYGFATLLKVGTNSWLCSGSLTA